VGKIGADLGQGTKVDLRAKFGEKVCKPSWGSNSDRKKTISLRKAPSGVILAKVLGQSTD